MYVFRDRAPQRDVFLAPQICCVFGSADLRLTSRAKNPSDCYKPLRPT